MPVVEPDKLPQYLVKDEKEEMIRCTVSCVITQCLLLFVALRRVDSKPSSSPPLLPRTRSTPSPTAAIYPHGRDRLHNYEILKDEVHYSGWRKVVRRSVTIKDHPHQRIVDFDIIDQARTSRGAVIVFAWNSTSKTATIIREYMPGPHRVLSGLAAGIIEDEKHAEEIEEEISLVAARYELEEEWYVVPRHRFKSILTSEYCMTNGESLLST